MWKFLVFVNWMVGIVWQFVVCCGVVVVDQVIDVFFGFEVEVGIFLVVIGVVGYVVFFIGDGCCVVVVDDVFFVQFLVCFGIGVFLGLVFGVLNLFGGFGMVIQIGFGYFWFGSKFFL